MGFSSELLVSEVWFYFFEGLPYAYFQKAFSGSLPVSFRAQKAHPLIDVHWRRMRHSPVPQHHLIDSFVAGDETRKFHLTDFKQPLIFFCFKLLENVPVLWIQLENFAFHVVLPVVAFDQSAYLEIDPMLLSPLFDLQQCVKTLRMRAVPTLFRLI